MSPFPQLLDRIRKRVGELTVNVQVLPELKWHDNGGECVVLTVPRSVGVASTSDGRYFLCVGDTCRPVVGDDVLRLANRAPTCRAAWCDPTARRASRS